jgi:hypothetical protein
MWSPPPGAADVTVEELRKSLIKGRGSTHVFLCPRLLTPQWRRQLNKACDLVVYMHAGSEVWPCEMHEPLTLGFVFLFLAVRPWQVCGTPKMLHLGTDNVKASQRQEYGYKGYFVQALQAAVGSTDHARRCGVENAIFRIKKFHSM